MRDAATSLRVRLFCSDCTGTDPMGCFEGGTEIVSAKEPPYEHLTFDALDAAKLAGYEETKNAGPWGFEVIDEDGEVIYATDA